MGKRIFKAMNKKGSDKAIQIISYLFLGLFAIFCFYPLLITLAVSFSDENTVMLHGFKIIPDKISFNTYEYLFESIGRKILKSYFVTISNTAIGTLSALFVTAMMAYTTSQKHVKYRNAISLFAYFTVVFSAGIVPWYVVCVSIYNLKNTIFALFVPYLVNVFLLFILRNYFASIPTAISESAKIDGANDFTIFLRLIVPLSKTAMLTIGFLYALQYWNDWWLPIMLISDNKYYTLQYFLYTMLTSSQAFAMNTKFSSSRIQMPSETIKMAVTVVTIGPIVLLYPLIQKYFVKGIIVGAVKG